MALVSALAVNRSLSYLDITDNLLTDTSAGELVPVVVGARGTGGNGSSYDGGIGAYGRVTITWN